eukprot:g4321.t1
MIGDEDWFWYFIDNDDVVQGPFEQEEMRIWYEAGYLSQDLMIQLVINSHEVSDDKFASLLDHFPDLSKAFLEGVVPFKESENAPHKRQESQEWYFVGDEGETEGPFSTSQMREWHLDGYFTAELMINDGENDWAELREYFPHLEDAFTLSLSTTSSGGIHSPAHSYASSHHISATSIGDGGELPTFTSVMDGRFNFCNLLPDPPAFSKKKKNFLHQRKRTVQMFQPLDDSGTVSAGTRSDLDHCDHLVLEIRKGLVEGSSSWFGRSHRKSLLSLVDELQVHLGKVRNSFT